MEVFRDAPVWFLIVVILVLMAGTSLLFSYFLWSIREGVRDLKDAIEKLFDKNDAHEKRISRIEGKCFNGECGN